MQVLAVEQDVRSGPALQTRPPRLVCGSGIPAACCGLTRVEDQQLAGLVMWVPAGLSYLGVALFILGRGLNTPKRGPFSFEVC